MAGGGGHFKSLAGGHLINTKMQERERAKDREKKNAGEREKARTRESPVCKVYMHAALQIQLETEHLWCKQPRSQMQMPV